MRIKIFPPLEEVQSRSAQNPLGTISALGAHALTLELLQTANLDEPQTRETPFRQAGQELEFPSWTNGLAYVVSKLRSQ